MSECLDQPWWLVRLIMFEARMQQMVSAVMKLPEKNLCVKGLMGFFNTLIFENICKLSLIWL